MALTIAGIALGLLVIGGYAFDWAWTGFQGNTFWDWLHLLLVPFLLPAAVTWLSTRARAPRPVRRPQPARSRSSHRLHLANARHSCIYGRADRRVSATSPVTLPRLTHLQRLEAESIHIMREVGRRVRERR